MEAACGPAVRAVRMAATPPRKPETNRKGNRHPARCTFRKADYRFAKSSPGEPAPGTHGPSLVYWRIKMAII
jgi:hypothetical protein